MPRAVPVKYYDGYNCAVLSQSKQSVHCKSTTVVKKNYHRPIINFECTISVLHGVLMVSVLAGDIKQSGFEFCQRIIFCSWVRHLTLQCLSPPRCINKKQQIVGQPDNLQVAEPCEPCKPLKAAFYVCYTALSKNSKFLKFICYKHKYITVW